MTRREHPTTRVEKLGRNGNASRVVVLVDQGPLRQSAAAECSAAMARLEELRAAWNRFEREDKPSFVRWRAREFGPLLSQLREIEMEVRECETLVHEVEMEMRRGFYDPQTAYQRVLFRRENPSVLTDASPEPRSRGTGDESPKLTEFEQEALFQDWVRKFIGTNPDKLDDKAYSTTFEAFKSHMFRTAPPEPVPAQNFRREKNEERRAIEDDPASQPGDPRVKELYRLLVRRLHPDLRADGIATVSALWHEVQEAYAATDVAHLEILLALSDIASDRFSDETSVSQMRAVSAQLERALFALEDSVRQAQNENAWNFARAGAGPNLRADVEKELQANLRRRSERLDLLQQTIGAWSRREAGDVKRCRD
jgi:hypothetical protein